MDLPTAIQELKDDLQRYVASGKASSRAVFKKELILNAIIEGFNEMEAEVLELGAQQHTAQERATRAEAMVQILAEWAILNGGNPHDVLALDPCEEVLQKFRNARMELAATAVKTEQYKDLLIANPERHRLAWFLILKHSMPPEAFAKHQATIERISTASA